MTSLAYFAAACHDATCDVSGDRISQGNVIYLGTILDHLSLDAIKRSCWSFSKKKKASVREKAMRDSGSSRLRAIKTIPCPTVQQGLWFLDQLDKRASVAYHIPRRVRLSGALDVGTAAGIERWTRSSNATRDAAHFELQDSEAVQRIRSADEVSAGALRSERGRTIRSRRHAETGAAGGQRCVRPGHRSPLVRGGLLKLAEHESMCCWRRVHHIVASDGWSMELC